MSKNQFAILWAAIIIGAALIATGQGMSDGASFGIVAGLTGAAIGHLRSDLGCGRGCLS